MTATYDPTAQFDIDVSEEIYRSGRTVIGRCACTPQGDGPFASCSMRTAGPRVTAAI